MIKLTLLIISAIIFQGCPKGEDPIDSSIVITNQSDETIVYSVEINLPEENNVRDISYQLSSDNIEEISLAPLESDTLNESFEKILSEDFPDRILMVYLFSRDTIEQVPWERIENENIILQRFDLTLEDIDSPNWIIIYQ